MSQPHPNCRQWFDNLLSDAHAEGYSGAAALHRIAERAGNDAGRIAYAAGTVAAHWAQIEALSCGRRFADILTAGGLSRARRAPLLERMTAERRRRVTELESSLGLWAARDRARGEQARGGRP